MADGGPEGGGPVGAESGVIAAYDHVLLAAPPGAEEALRAFYGGLLGMVEEPKPPVLAARGGCWFRAAGGAVRLHLGVEEGFAPPRKAHPAFRVVGIDAVAARLVAAGVPVRWDDDLPGHRRFHTEDPVGNRLEVLEPVTP
ncbi:VOC family protein [Streptomyces sp. NPDC054784]